jgi:hypothetical protein
MAELRAEEANATMNATMNAYVTHDIAYVTLGRRA